MSFLSKVVKKVGKVAKKTVKVGGHVVGGVITNPLGYQTKIARNVLGGSRPISGKGGIIGGAKEAASGTKMLISAGSAAYAGKSAAKGLAALFGELEPTTGLNEQNQSSYVKPAAFATGAGLTLGGCGKASVMLVPAYQWLSEILKGVSTWVS